MKCGNHDGRTVFILSRYEIRALLAFARKVPASPRAWWCGAQRALCGIAFRLSAMRVEATDGKIAVTVTTSNADPSTRDDLEPVRVVSRIVAERFAKEMRNVDRLALVFTNDQNLAHAVVIPPGEDLPDVGAVNAIALMPETYSFPNAMHAIPPRPVNEVPGYVSVNPKFFAAVASVADACACFGVTLQTYAPNEPLRFAVEGKDGAKWVGAIAPRRDNSMGEGDAKNRAMLDAFRA